MLFNSFSFLYLYLITFLLYYLPVLRKHQIKLLIFSSLFFYGYHTPKLLLLLVTSVSINTLSSYYITYGSKRYQKFWAVTGVVLNLTILAFFKYSPLIAVTFLPDTSSFTDFLIKIPLPIGISFFTFEGISLLVDVYKGNYLKSSELVPVSVTKHARNTLFFVSFFPHLIAGPILKAHDFLPQIGGKYLSDIKWELVFKSLVTGFFLKMVVADNLKDFTNQIEFPYFVGLSSLTLISLLIGYSFQIFADFAGYSLIAIGLAGSFGYDFNINFNFPYVASSFKDFWKRWHISLSSFLMEYLYFPLGGNRKGKIRTYINLLITMILGGLWHGASWSYAIWGLIHGLLLSIERLFSDSISVPASKFYRLAKSSFVFGVITVAWLLFKLPNFSHVIHFAKSVYNNIELESNYSTISNIILLSLPVILYHLRYILRRYDITKIVEKYKYIPYGIMLFLILTNSGLAGEFIYFQF
jgi:alginate O-acetyltransferase complex protein AlgI